eukprot:7386179-Prymnesium_polylepis.1
MLSDGMCVAQGSVVNCGMISCTSPCWVHAHTQSLGVQGLDSHKSHLILAGCSKGALGISKTTKGKAADRRGAPHAGPAAQSYFYACTCRGKICSLPTPSAGGIPKGLTHSRDATHTLV